MRYSIGGVNYELVSRAGLIVITGKPETVDFCREASDLIKSHNEAMGILWSCETLAEFEQRARVPAFLGRWWYTGSADNISVADKRALERLIKKPVEYGTAVLIGTNYTKYRNVTRGLRKAGQAHEISASFPSERFLIRHVQRKVISKGYKIAHDNAKRFVRRLGAFYPKYDYYIDLMVSELSEDDWELSRGIIDKTLRGVTGATFNTFMKYLTKPLSSGEMKRTTELYKNYWIVREEGPAKVLRKVHQKAMQYLEIRRLINEGYLPVGIEYSVAAFAKLIGNPEEKDDNLDEETSEGGKKKKKGSSGVFTYKDILNWSDYKLNKEVAMAATLPLSDWLAIALMSDVPYATDEEAEMTLFDIMTRSRRTLEWSALQREGSF